MGGMIKMAKLELASDGRRARASAKNENNLAYLIERYNITGD